jgi:hypothetical protein
VALKSTAVAVVSVDVEAVTGIEADIQADAGEEIGAFAPSICSAAVALAFDSM